MKQVLFIMTHPESGWESLVEVLEEHPSIQCFQIAQSYHHPDDLEVLTDHVHKKDNSAAVWATVILHNKDFTCRALAKYCKFIYWSSKDEPEDDLHIRFRLRGMQIWYKRTGGLWNPSLTKEDALFAAVLGREDH